MVMGMEMGPLWPFLVMIVDPRVRIEFMDREKWLHSVGQVGLGEGLITWITYGPFEPLRRKC